MREMQMIWSELKCRAGFYFSKGQVQGVLVLACAERVDPRQRNQKP